MVGTITATKASHIWECHINSGPSIYVCGNIKFSEKYRALPELTVTVNYLTVPPEPLEDNAPVVVVEVHDT